MPKTQTKEGYGNMRKVYFGLLGFAVVLSANATTKTVGKSGAEFTSIQAAINSFTEAEVTDGQPDVVEIIDGETYDEQVVIGKLIADPAGTGQGEGYLDAAIDLAKRSDPFTLRGRDPNNRPKINPVNVEGMPYGVFTNDPGDNFVATLSYLGINLTVENIEILQASVIADDQYGLNGQAGNMVFRNVLFALEGDKQPGEALINFNNAIDIAGQGFDNSYTFENCTFDATFNGERNAAVDTIYFHGYSQGDADAAGIDPANVPVNVKFINSRFINSDTAVYIRGRAQANNVTFQNCYITKSNHGLRASGKGTFVVENCIFHDNMNLPDDIDRDLGAVETVGREGFTPELTIRNSLFVDNMSADAASMAGTGGWDSRAAAVRIQNDGTDPKVTIENCTFVNNPIAIRFADSSARPREGSVNNNIFQNSNVAVLTASDFQQSYFAAADIIDVLVVTGTNNVFDGNAVVVEDNDKLPNVNLQGTEASVTFTNTTINPADPFAGPPYRVASGAPAGVGADLSGGTPVPDFMLY